LEELRDKFHRVRFASDGAERCHRLPPSDIGLEARQPEFDLSGHIVSDVPRPFGLPQPLRHQVDPSFLDSKLLLESSLPFLHLGEATPSEGVALEGSILIKPSRETGAEIALDGMPSNVAVEKTSVTEEGILSGRGAGGGSQIHYSSAEGEGETHMNISKKTLFVCRLSRRKKKLSGEHRAAHR
jgi:hypothetical protein